jgi:hypothetical protein
MKNSILFKVWALASVILLASSSWGFETDEDSTVKGDLTVEGTISASSIACPSDMKKVGNVLCVDISKKPGASIQTAYNTCYGQKRRMCNVHDYTVMCIKNEGYTGFTSTPPADAPDKMWIHAGKNDEKTYYYNGCNASIAYVGLAEIAHDYHQPYVCCTDGAF